ncbi:MAG: hypothetical protein ACTSRL_20385, partial [Candidatus Helarchaeota archaeon]
MSQNKGTKLISFILIFILLIQFTSNFYHQSIILNGNSKIRNETINKSENLVDLFLQVSSEVQNDYTFSAYGHCIIGIEVDTIDFTKIYLDGEKLEVSYGYNVFYKDFGEIQQNHQISIDNPESISQLYIQPVIISHQEITINEGDTFELPFDAGGLIGLLIKPLDFSYNDLFIKIDDISLKDIYTDVDIGLDHLNSINMNYYPFYLFLNPGTHVLQLMGKGTIEFLIISEEDYDQDEIKVSDEILYSNDFDPIRPNNWGYYESGYKNGMATEEMTCILNVFIPDTPENNYFYIDVIRGEVSELSIDANALEFKDMTFTSTHFLKEILPGFHQIMYSVRGEEVQSIEYIERRFNFEVEFEINFNVIPIIDYFELRDSDGDSIKDVNEINSGLNPYKKDSDGDQLPDPYDLSPLHKIILNPKEIGQIIFPVKRDTTTILSIQIKKPEQNFMGKVLWRNELECTIIPGIRIFGNPSMDRQSLLSSYNYLLEDGTYEKESVKTYNLLDDYNPSGNGDYIPDSIDPSELFTFIPLQAAETSFDCEIIYEPNHPAKTNGDNALIDFRFDFIWIITYKNETLHDNILHFYPIEEPITIQSIKKQEVTNIDYILATPDSPIEHIIFQSIIENPYLSSQTGSLLENYQNFNVQDDVISSGNAPYTNFLNNLIIDFDTNPSQNIQNEVLYLTGTSTNLDILNEIKILENNIEMNEYEATQGKFSSVFTIFSAINSQDFKENYKIVENIFFSPRSGENKKILLGKVINLEIFDFLTSQAIRITRIHGGPIDKDLFVSNEANLDPHLKIEKQIWIDRYPLSHTIEFGEEDLSKVKYNNRQNEVDLDRQQFEHQSPSPLSWTEFWRNFIQKGFTDLKIVDHIKFLKVKFQYLFLEMSDPGLIRYFENDITKLNSYFDILAKDIQRIVFVDDINPSQIKFMIGQIDYLHNYLQERGAPLNEIELNKIETIRERLRATKSAANQYEYEQHRKVANKEPCYIHPECNDPRQMRRQKFSVKKFLKQHEMKIAGAALMIMGGIVIVCGLVNMINLIKGQIEGTANTDTVTFVLKLTQSIATIALGIVLMRMGSLIFTAEKAILRGATTTKAISDSVKFLGRICIVLTILISILEVGTLLSQYFSGAIELSDLRNALIEFAITLSVSLTLGILLPAVLGISGALASTGYGAILAVALIAMTFLGGWLTDLCNNPSIQPVEGGISLILPEEDMLRRGGLTVGDTIGLEIEVENNGDRWASFYSKIKADDYWGAGDETKGVDYEGNPPGPFIYPGVTQTLKVYDTITRPTTHQRIHFYYKARAVILKWVLVIPYYADEVIVEGTEIIPTKLPVCDASFSHFYDDTSPIETEVLAQNGEIAAIQRAIAEYRYKDARDITNSILSVTEEETRIPLSYFNNIKARATPYSADYDCLHTYNAEHSFDGDEGGHPSGWNIIAEGSGTHIKVIPMKDDSYGQRHDTVLELYDGDGFNWFDMNDYFGDRSTGTIEFWIMHDGGSVDYKDKIYLGLNDNGTRAITFVFSGTGDDLVYIMETGATIWSGFSPDTWYHIRIDFNCYTDTFSFYVNKIQKTGGVFPNRVTAIDSLSIDSGTSGSVFGGSEGGSTFWLDSIDYSWSPGYFLYRSYTQEFSKLILYYYPNIIAKVPLTPVTGIESHLGAISQSSGDVLISKSWMNEIDEKFDLYREALQIIQGLPLATNIKLKKIDIGPIDPETYTLSTTLQFNLDGPDDPLTHLEVDAPVGFSIVIDQVESYLSQGFPLTITQTDPTLLANLYYFHIRLIYNGQVIFEGDPAIRVARSHGLRVVEQEIPDIIIPGESYPILTLVNYGTDATGYRIFIGATPELLVDHFVIQDTDDGIVLLPTDVLDAVILQVPRHYSVTPGKYTFGGVVLDLLTDHEYSFINTFTMAIFHELQVNNVQAYSSNRPGTCSTLNCEVTNLGNAPEQLTFNLYVEGWDPSLFWSPTTVTINPGETKLFDLEINVEREPLLAPGNYTLTIDICGASGVLATTSSVLEILEFHDVSFEVENVTITDGASKEIEIKVQNIGNVVDQFSLEIEHLGTSINAIHILTDPVITLDPAESQIITVRIDPYEWGTESARITATFNDHEGNAVFKYEDFQITTIDDDFDKPIIIIKYLDNYREDFYYDINNNSWVLPYGLKAEEKVADNSLISLTDGYYVANTEFQKLWCLIYDQSGYDQITIEMNDSPISPNIIWKPRLIYPLSTQNTYELFVGRIVKQELFYASDDDENAGYLMLSGPFHPAIAQPVTVELDGIVWSYSSFQILERGYSFEARYPIPRDPGIHEFKIHIQYYGYEYVAYHTVYIADCAVVELPIPLQVDDPSTLSINEGLHNFSIYVRDNDFDSEREHDKLSSRIGWSAQILDDDTTEPEITITAAQISQEDLYNFPMEIDWTELPVTVNDYLAQLSLARVVSWSLRDDSGFSRVQVTYEIEGFDGTIYLPETIIFNTTVPIYSTDPPTIQGSTTCSLIQGYHRFRVSCTDGDEDREGDTLSSYKEYVLTIVDDDVAPLELLDISFNSDLMIAGVPMIEVQASITDPAFERVPSQYQFFIFVDDQWVPDVTVSCELYYDETTDPPTFTEALVKFLFENTWLEEGSIGSHTLEIVTIDDDYDVIYENPDPFYPYIEPNFALYQILQMTEDISMFDYLKGAYADPLPYFEGYQFNFTILHQLADLLGIAGFPSMNLTIIDPIGNNVTQSYVANPYFTPILPSFYLSAELFYTWLTSLILTTYNIPWDLPPESIVSATRGQLDISSLLYQLFRRVFIKGAPLFNGLFLNYSFQHSAGVSGTLNLSYSDVGISRFHVTGYSQSGGYTTPL